MDAGKMSSSHKAPRSTGHLVPMALAVFTLTLLEIPYLSFGLDGAPVRTLFRQ
jgi:hypothetical protein